MILQALKEYYDRKAADEASDIAPVGWERKELPFVIVLDNSGTPIGIDDTREGNGKAKRAKAFLVPQGVKRSSGIAANLFWDNPEYALGLKIKGTVEQVRQKHAAFVDRIKALSLKDAEVGALLSFLGRDDKIDHLTHYAVWSEIKDTAPFISFRIADSSHLVCRGAAVLKVLDAKKGSGFEYKGVCLVTGEVDELEVLHAAIKGVRDANSTGANIVGFNLDAFKSFGKVQGANAPVGKRASFAYTTALNTLLGKDSRQKLLIGDATTVFWSARRSVLEEQVSAFFSEPPKDNPDQLVEAVKSLYRSVETGAPAFDGDDTRFYCLGLAPNAARIAVRFWHCGTVAELAGRFRAHFDDLRIVHGPRDREHVSLWRLLVSTAVQGKSENIPPNLAGETMRAILEGTPYPATLLQTVLRRVKAEHEVTYARAALLKAVINRKNRYTDNSNKEDIKVSLDTGNGNVGYLLGRLFAVLEKIQTEAQGGTNATIRDKFYGAASGTPATVFGTLMRLKNHHLAKLPDGLRIVRERLIGEIMGGIADFPPHLRLEDQGRFAIGYYHQMQDFFTKKQKD